MKLFVSLMMALAHIHMVSSKGNVGYCTLDQVKYGGQDQCSNGGTDIDFTPTPQGEDWSYYVGIGGSILTVIAPGFGPSAVIYTNLFNNIALKYGASVGSVTSDEIAALIEAIEDKINGEILTLKECLTTTILNEIGTLYTNEISGFITNLESVAGIQDQELHEEKFDDLYDDMCSFAETNFNQALDNDYNGLKYEILAPVFDKFIYTFDEISKGYFAAKQILCTDSEQKDPDTCINEFNYYLQRAKTAMTKMQTWITDGLQTVKTQMDAITILHKDCTGISYDHQHFDFGVTENYDISALYFMEDSYGEAYPDVVDIDSDYVHAYLKMNDEGDKWCDLDSRVWCDTYTTDDNECCTLCFSCNYEHPSDSCKNSLNEKGCAKKAELQAEIDEYWSNLQAKYITPLDSIITEFNNIEMTQTKSPTVAPTRSPTQLPTQAPTLCSLIWEQCGGNDWTGSTCCSDGLVCNRQSEWYSQCVPPDQVWEENQ